MTDDEAVRAQIERFKKFSAQLDALRAENESKRAAAIRAQQEPEAIGKSEPQKPPVPREE